MHLFTVSLALMISIFSMWRYFVSQSSSNKTAWAFAIVGWLSFLLDEVVK